jgi:hypothetical protein
MRLSLSSGITLMHPLSELGDKIGKRICGPLKSCYRGKLRLFVFVPEAALPRRYRRGDLVAGGPQWNI